MPAVPLPDELQAWLIAAGRCRRMPRKSRTRYPNEPYRLILSLLANDLAEASQDDMKSRLLSARRTRPAIQLEDLTEPLEAIANAVPPAVGRGPLEYRAAPAGNLWPARRAAGYP